MKELCPGVWPGLATDGDAGRDFLAGLVLRDLAAERIEHAADVLEVALEDRIAGPLAHLAVVHPELPFHCRNHDLGVGEGRLVLGREQAVDVVAVEVRDDDGVDCRAVDAGRRKVVVELADLALGLRELVGPETGIDHDELRPGVDDDRIEGVGDLVGRQMVLGEDLVDVVLAGAGRVIVRQVDGRDAVADHGDLVGADIVAVEARILGRCRGAAALAGDVFTKGRSAEAAAPASVARRVISVMAMSWGWVANERHEPARLWRRSFSGTPMLRRNSAATR